MVILMMLKDLLSLAKQRIDVMIFIDEIPDIIHVHDWQAGCFQYILEPFIIMILVLQK